MPAENAVYENRKGEAIGAVRSFWELDREDMTAIEATRGQVYIVLTVYAVPTPPVNLACEPKGLHVVGGNGSPT